jgi:hypothetical protein
MKKQTKLTPPPQSRLKEVLKPIIKNIISESSTLEKSWGIDDYVFRIYSDNSIRIKSGQTEISMDSVSAKKLARLILKNL